jgi:hypothetical protein
MPARAGASAAVSVFGRGAVWASHVRRAPLHGHCQVLTCSAVARLGGGGGCQSGVWGDAAQDLVEDRGALLPRRRRVLGLRDVERAFVERADEDVSEGLDGLGHDRAGVYRRSQRELDQAKTVAAGQVPPCLPAEDGGCVEQDDPLGLGLGAGVEEQPTLTALLAMLKARPARSLPTAYGWLTHGDLPHDLVEQWLGAYFADRGVRRDLRRLTAALGDDEFMNQIAAELASFARPALLAWAADDKFFPAGHARRLAAILPDARVELVPGSRTWAMRDQPEQTARLIAEFARRAAARPAA